MPGPKNGGVSEGDLVVGQTLIALGQGMGVAAPSAGALAAFLEAFGADLRASVGTWDEIRLVVTENARQIGRLAAGYASAEGSTSVARPHMRKAIKTANAPRAEMWILKPCPFCKEG